MNAIKNYLDNMFRNLPNTEEVRRAKSELLQMMEDKYEELISEGKTENEAVGIVISEFGNLDELAESLGIQEAVTENPDEDKPMLSMDRVKEYLEANNLVSILKPLAIALCIFCSAFPIITDMIKFANFDAIGVTLLLLAICGAVMLFIFTGTKKKEFAEVEKKECSLSIESAEYVRSERKSFKSSYGLMSSIGIGLCILSILNIIVIGSISFINSSFVVVLFLLFIALGVFLITSANSKMDGYDKLLELNESGKMSEEFVPKSDRKVNKTPIIICAVVTLVIACIIGGLAVVRTVLKTVTFINNIPAINFSSGDGAQMETTYELAGKTEEYGDITSMKLDLDACSADIVVGEGSGLVSVEYSGDDDLKPVVAFDNGKLVITQRGNTFNFDFGIHTTDVPKLLIVLGSDVELENIEMDIDAGDITMSGIKANYFYGVFDAGNLEMNGCTIGKAEIEADAGNVEIGDSDIKTLKVDTDAGNVEINDTAFDEISIEADFGNVDIKVLDDIDAYDISCDIDAGRVKVGNASSGGSYHQSGSGAGTISVEVDAGNIEIK